MRHQTNIDLPPALRPSPTSCRRIAPSCCRRERQTRIRRFRRATKQWVLAQRHYQE